MLLKGKRVLVTGGVTGTGRATVLAAAREGAKVVSVSRAAPGDERAIKVVEAAKKIGEGPIVHMQLDITKQADVDRVFAKAIEFLGGLDGLIHSAGTPGPTKPTEDLVEEDLHEQFSMHLLGTAFTNAAACRHMKNNGGGSIVNLASYGGVVGRPERAAYGAAKGSQISYTRIVAREWAKYQIRANIVCPAVHSEMADVNSNQMSDEQRAQFKAWMKSVIPLGGDLGKAEDAANLCVFLVSDMSSFMTGQLIGVDGGMMMGR